ncbi:MAG: LysR family transcriptional regulator [Eubacteriaceae bacterium]|jgi:DNA-binding transcriptional LysR family regulator|nr:LysR family transcriptional regulator [Eubacteriaceae bacterium]
MEIYVLRNFLEIAREGSITAAAGTLHISQSTLSMQIKSLENELGKKLFTRHSRSVSLTDEGMVLRKRAEDILNMVDKTAAEFREMNIIRGGDIRIGCAESYLIKHLAHAISDFRRDYPLLRFHITSGGTEQVLERLDHGILDLAVIVEPPHLERYNYLEIPGEDTWGIVVRRDHPLAARHSVTVSDLKGEDLIISEQSLKADLPRWCGEKVDELRFAGYTNLAYNGSVFAREGLGVLLAFEHLIECGADSELCFVPLSPRLTNKIFIVWKKYQIFTPIADLFTESLIKRFAAE